MPKPFSTILLLTLALVFCASCNTKPATATTKSDIVANQIIVLLQGRIPGKQLEQPFAAYELQAKGQSSRSENRWIYTFNPSKIKIEELLKKVKASELVIEADYVKKG